MCVALSLVANNGISIHNSPEISDIKVHVNDIGIGVVVSF